MASYPLPPSYNGRPTSVSMTTSMPIASSSSPSRVTATGQIYTHKAPVLSDSEEGEGGEDDDVEDEKDHSSNNANGSASYYPPPPPLFSAHTTNNSMGSSDLGASLSRMNIHDSATSTTTEASNTTQFSGAVDKVRKQVHIQSPIAAHAYIITPTPSSPRSSNSSPTTGRKKQPVVPMPSDDEEEEEEDDDEEEYSDSDDSDNEDGIESDDSDVAPKLKRGMTKSRAKRLAARRQQRLGAVAAIDRSDGSGSSDEGIKSIPQVPKIPSQYTATKIADQAQSTPATNITPDRSLQQQKHQSLQTPTSLNKGVRPSSIQGLLDVQVNAGSLSKELSFDNMFGSGHSRPAPDQSAAVTVTSSSSSNNNNNRLATPPRTTGGPGSSPLARSRPVSAQDLLYGASAGGSSANNSRERLALSHAEVAKSIGLPAPIRPAAFTSESSGGSGGSSNGSNNGNTNGSGSGTAGAKTPGHSAPNSRSSLILTSTPQQNGVNNISNGIHGSSSSSSLVMGTGGGTSSAAVHLQQQQQHRQSLVDVQNTLLLQQQLQQQLQFNQLQQQALALQAAASAATATTTIATQPTMNALGLMTPAPASGFVNSSPMLTAISTAAAAAPRPLSQDFMVPPQAYHPPAGNPALQQQQQDLMMIIQQQQLQITALAQQQQLAALQQQQQQMLAKQDPVAAMAVAAATKAAASDNATNGSTLPTLEMTLASPLTPNQGSISTSNANAAAAPPSAINESSSSLASSSTLSLSGTTIQQQPQLLTLGMQPVPMLSPLLVANHLGANGRPRSATYSGMANGGSISEDDDTPLSAQQPAAMAATQPAFSQGGPLSSSLPRHVGGFPMAIAGNSSPMLQYQRAMTPSTVHGSGFSSPVMRPRQRSSSNSSVGSGPMYQQAAAQQLSQPRLSDFIEEEEHRLLQLQQQQQQQHQQQPGFAAGYTAQQRLGNQGVFNAQRASMSSFTSSSSTSGLGIGGLVGASASSSRLSLNLSALQQQSSQPQPVIAAGAAPVPLIAQMAAHHQQHLQPSHTLIHVQPKPPPPQTGLVGAISAMERDKKMARANPYHQQLQYQHQQALHQYHQLHGQHAAQHQQLQNQASAAWVAEQQKLAMRGGGRLATVSDDDDDRPLGATLH